MEIAIVIGLLLIGTIAGALIVAAWNSDHEPAESDGWPR